MLIKNKNGSEVSLTENEICIIWYEMTGMGLAEISKFMRLSVDKITSYKQKCMVKLKVANKSEFVYWFLLNRSSFICDDLSLLVLKRGDSFKTPRSIAACELIS